jgi:maltooligosyltrehalose trehalohydrolase
MLRTLAATPCLEARTSRQDNALVVTWQFEARRLTIALNPTYAPHDLACVIPVSTGDYCQDGEVLRLGPWSAVAW